jgi:hypothetical protein
MQIRNNEPIHLKHQIQNHAPCHLRVLQQWRDIIVICRNFDCREEKVVGGKRYLEEEEQAGAGVSGTGSISGFRKRECMQLPTFLYHA